VKSMNKHINPEYFIEQVGILREVGIVSNTSVVFGYPQETPETIKKTFDMCLQSKIYPSIGFLLPLPATVMYQYAIDNGFIKDEDKYLMDITERQDICINLTQYADEEILLTIEKYAQELNEKLELGLESNTLIKTGGYKEHTNKNKQLSRESNSLSLNYSETEFNLATKE